MTTTADARIQYADGAVLTPKLRHTARRWVFWIVIAILLVLIAIIAVAGTGVTTSSARLSATNPGPAGAEALVSVLRENGVTVMAPRSLAKATKDAERDPGATTVVLYDPSSILSAAQIQRLRSSSVNLVLIEPNSRSLDELAPDVAQAGYVSPTAKADCTYRPVERAGSVYGLSEGYRIIGTTVDEEGCLGGRGVYSLIRAHNADQVVTILGGTTILTNQSIVQRGNAALALGLFGSTKHLVWYRPSLTDAPGVPEDQVLPNPPWVQPAIALAFLVLVAAGVWRGRRLGPIVVENLPVTVRASETLEGRARLYQRASARGHALDALRIGVISRLASLCGLPTIATVDQVIAAVAPLTGRDRAAVRALLVDDIPANDRQLVQLSDELSKLEDDVARAVTPA